MADQIRIRPVDGTWSIRAGGAVLGETRAALELTDAEGGTVIYVPRNDIAMAFLDKSGTVTTSPDLGEATHYSIVTKSTVLRDAAWSYENPPQFAGNIAGYLAFYPSDTVAVEKI